MAGDPLAKTPAPSHGRPDVERAEPVSSAVEQAMAYGGAARAIATSDRPLHEQLALAAYLLGSMAYESDPPEVAALVWPWIGPLVREALAVC
jgi:hypothetical protein